MSDIPKIRQHDTACRCAECLVGDTHQILHTVLPNLEGDMQRLSFAQLAYKVKIATVYLRALYEEIAEADVLRQEARHD
jgi:hypothetical protein